MKLLKRLKVFSTVSKSISTARQLLLSDLGLLRGWQCPGGLHGNHNRLAAPNLCHSNVNRKDGARSQLKGEQLIVANARLQAKIYKILTLAQQRKIDKMRTQTAGLTKPPFLEW